MSSETRNVDKHKERQINDNPSLPGYTMLESIGATIDALESLPDRPCWSGFVFSAATDRKLLARFANFETVKSLSRRHVLVWMDTASSDFSEKETLDLRSIQGSGKSPSLLIDAGCFDMVVLRSSSSQIAAFFAIAKDIKRQWLWNWWGNYGCALRVFRRTEGWANGLTTDCTYLWLAVGARGISQPETRWNK